MSIHARFRLVEDSRVKFWNGGQNHNAAHVKMAAVQGEPFGPATPSGTIDMLIVNPDAVKVFRAAHLDQEFDVVITPVVVEEEGK